MKIDVHCARAGKNPIQSKASEASTTPKEHFVCVYDGKLKIGLKYGFSAVLWQHASSSSSISVCVCVCVLCVCVQQRLIYKLLGARGNTNHGCCRKKRVGMDWGRVPFFECVQKIRIATYCVLLAHIVLSWFHRHRHRRHC